MALDRARADLEQLYTEYAEWDRRSKDYSRDGYPAQAEAGPRGKGTISDPTFAAATTLDEVRALRKAQFADIAELDKLVARLRDRHRVVLGRAPERIQAAARQNQLTKCANGFGCPTDAWADPGRAGRCTPCWRYRKDHQGLDRRYVYDRQEEPA